MARSDSEILEAVREAIYATVTGNYQSLSASGRNLVRLSLKELREMEQDYAARVQEATAGGGVALVRFDEPQ